MISRLEAGALLTAALVVGVFVVSFALDFRPTALVPASEAPVEPVRAPALTVEAPPALGQVEVLNRSRQAGLARVATDRLRETGFDVVYFGNAPASLPDSSVVFDRVGRPEIARLAAARLGITRVVTRIDKTLLVDASIVIGGDWAQATERSVSTEAAAEAANPDGDGWLRRLRSGFARWRGRD
jgi:hypothetical protein